jgi:hypothetical protein
MADASSMSMEVRVKYLEQLTKQLGDQVKVMKQLVSTEVADLKNVMQLQVAEVKQIVMHQDRVYQDRIRRLETRIEQLSEFCMQMARSTGSSGALRDLPADLFDGVSGGGGGGGGGGRGASSPSPARGGGGGDDDDEEEGASGLEGVSRKYKEKLDAIYKFYTTSNIQVFHPAMTISQFAKLCRDCNLNDFNSGTPTELLWMAVMRRLGTKRKRRVPSNLRNATTINTGKFTAKRGVKNFAYERLDEIPEEAFPEALYALAMEKIGKDRIDLPPETVFETFLITDIFPSTDSKMDAYRALMPMTAEERSTVAADSIMAYKTPEVKNIVKEYMARLKTSYKRAVGTQDYRSDAAMNLDAFVEFVRQQELMPLISKPDVRQIFIACSQIEKVKNPQAEPDTVSLPSLILALYHLADRIYGDPLYIDKYPTPEARVQKILAKMYLLR